MSVVFITSIIAIFLTYLSGQKKYSKLKLFELAFILLTIIACIHYNYGNDYMRYYSEFQNLSHNQNVWQLVASGFYNEPGWILLNWFLPKPHGFFLLVAIISIIENYIYYRLIRDNVEDKKRWISVAIYLFATSYYVLNFSMLRQGLTIALCIAAGMLASKKKRISALILVIAASTIHVSVLVFIPFVLISFLPLKKGKIYGISFLIIAIALYFFGNTVSGIFSFLTDSVTSLQGYVGYTDTISGWGNTLGIGFLLSSITYIVFYYLMIRRFNEFTYELRYYLLLSCVSFCVIPFQISISSLAGRMGYYFSAFHIIMVPKTYNKIKNLYIRYGLSAIYVLMLFIGYYNFFFNSWANTLYANFHTIFDVLF